MSAQKDFISLHGSESQQEDIEYLYTDRNIFVFLYLLLVAMFSLVPILSLCWIVVRFSLDERSWEQDIERYNQVRIHELVMAARSVGQKVKPSIAHKIEEVNV